MLVWSPWRDCREKYNHISYKSNGDTIGPTPGRYRGDLWKQVCWHKAGVFEISISDLKWRSRIINEVKQKTISLIYACVYLYSFVVVEDSLQIQKKIRPLWFSIDLNTTNKSPFDETEEGSLIPSLATLHFLYLNCNFWDLVICNVDFKRINLVGWSVVCAMTPSAKITYPSVGSIEFGTYFQRKMVDSGFSKLRDMCNSVSFLKSATV